MIAKKTAKPKPIVTDSHWTNEATILKQILVSIEKQSEHPLAEAVIKHFGDINSIIADLLFDIIKQFLNS